MDRTIINTSIRDLFLKALGPFRVHITGEFFSIPDEKELIDYGKLITVGKIFIIGQNESFGNEQKVTSK